MNVLILGGNGFIGRNLANFLLKANMNVFSYDICVPEVKNSKIQYIQGNFFDEDTSIPVLVDGMDVVIHSISILNPGNAALKYMEAYKKEFTKSVELFSYLAENNKKGIFLSSGGTVYGNQKVMPISEFAVCNANNHYTCLKICIENVIKVLNLQYDANLFIARISNPYGRGQNYKKGVGFISAVLNGAINNEIVEIWGDGENIRDYIYIDDVCGMLLELIKYNGVERIFNISSCSGISQNSIINIVKQQYPNLKIQYRKARSVDLRKVILDNNLIKKIYTKGLIDINDGIKLYINAILEGKDGRN